MVEYIEDKDLAGVLDLHLDSHTKYPEFRLIRANNIGVRALLKVDLKADGEVKPCKNRGITLKRLGDPERVLMPDHPAFLLIVDSGKWNELNSTQRNALVHHGLSQIKVDKKDDGTVKLGKAAFDYQGFLTTVERYGPITDADLNLREVMRTTGTKLAKMVEDAGVNKSKTPPPKEEETHIEQGEAELPPPRRKK